MTQILVVDDDLAVAGRISRVLDDADFQVRSVGTGAAALRAAEELNPDLVILELILPDMRGEELLAKLTAARPGRRVVVLTSVTQLASRVAVLAGGAVDYMAKPFANSELVARVRARLREPENPRRAPWPPVAGRAGPELDYVQRQVVMVNGQTVDLTAKEFFLLSYLLQRAPESCSRAELLTGVWGTTFDSGNGGNLLEVHISRLRSKLVNTKIVTVRNVGYRLVTA